MPIKSYSEALDDNVVKEDAVYQINTNNTPRRRYVRTVRIYGDKGVAECEVIHDKVKADIGKIVTCDISVLTVPDQYPSQQFNPQRWVAKVAQSREEKKKEIDVFITAHMEALSVTASDVMIEENARKTVESIKSLMLPFFGGFTLALFLNFVKSKINNAIEKRTQGYEPKPFRTKVSELNRIWSKRAADDTRKFADNLFKKHSESETGDKKADKK